MIKTSTTHVDRLCSQKMIAFLISTQKPFDNRLDSAATFHLASLAYSYAENHRQYRVRWPAMTWRIALSVRRRLAYATCDPNCPSMASADSPGSTADRVVSYVVYTATNTGTLLSPVKKTMNIYINKSKFGF